MVYCIEPKGEFRKILMYTLESCGYTSEAIPSGKELLEVLKAAPSGTDPSGL